MEHDHKHTIDQKYDQYDNAYAYDVQASDVWEWHDMSKHTRSAYI